MIKKQGYIMMRFAVLLSLFLSMQWSAYAGDKDFPPRPNPPRLVNDLAGVMSQSERDQLEAKLVEFDRTTSTQVAIVTITDLGDYDAGDYAIKLFNLWAIGQKDKNNGVLIFAAIGNHKAWITTGRGVEGALTDAQCGRIVRNEMVPSFKEAQYYQGFTKAADAVIAATKGEYKADERGQKKDLPAPLIVLIIAIIYFVLWLIRRGGGGGGTYVSGRGLGGWGGGWSSGGGSSSWGGGGGGFGGFGGGSSGGGGAGGSW